MKIFKHLFLSVIALSLSMTIVAQTPTPYSRYGYGILQDNETSAQRAMGGVGYAMSSGRKLPALSSCFGRTGKVHPY